jgi:ABC-type uncharacterized transport system ATPase subunit
MMVGRPIQSELPRAPFNPGAPVLKVSNLQLKDANGVQLLADIDFTCAPARSWRSPACPATARAS